MVSVEELRKAIEWLRDTTNDNVIYIDKDLKIELGNTINDLLKLNEIYKTKIDKAIEYIKENEFYLDYKTGACIKGVMPLLEILGDKENE